MKIFNEEKTAIEKIVCNKCGKNILVENGIVKEGIFEVDYNWGYFSNKDGKKHRFDLCEKCYDDIVDQFKVQIAVKENIELI